MSIPQEIKIISQIGNQNFQHPIWQTEIAGDCSYWILLLLSLERIVDGSLQLDDVVSHHVQANKGSNPTDHLIGCHHHF